MGWRRVGNVGPDGEPAEPPTLDTLAREGTRRMLMAALEAEVTEHIGRFGDTRDANGRRLVVRNGQAQERTVTCGAGTWPVRASRVNDKRVDADGNRERFTSRILPPYMRRSPQVSEVLPLLYLRGLSTGTSVPHFQDHASDNWEPEGAGSDGVVNRSWSGRRSNMLSWSTCSIW